jgi:hypothetical protein
MISGKRSRTFTTILNSGKFITHNQTRQLLASLITGNVHRPTMKALISTGCNQLRAS